MGNHQAGHSMVLIATALAEQREKTGQTAMEILDKACEEYRGADAEFDDDLQPDTVLGKLIAEASGLENEYKKRLDEGDEEEAEDYWDEYIYDDFFKKRYDFC